MANVVKILFGMLIIVLQVIRKIRSLTVVENLVKVFGAENVHCTDLNPKNLGTRKFGAEIWDGRTNTERLITWCDVLLATSSTIINDTFDGIKKEADVKGKRLIIFGVTGAGVSTLIGRERLCFQPH